MAVNMKDIANATNLSIATVSNYINGAKIRPENAEKIEKAIKALNYRVNTIARGLKTQKSLLLGALVPNATDIFSLEIIIAIDKYMSTLGYRCLICDSQLDSSIMMQNLELLLEKQVDGIFIFPLMDDGELVKILSTIDIPVVVIDQQLNGIECDTVIVDNENASFMVVDSLIKEGHKKIGVLCGPIENYTAQERLKGYIRAFEENNLEIDENMIVHGDYTTKSGYDMLYRLWDNSVKPTAIFATNGNTTSGAMLAARELNIDIGNTVKLFAFDNYEIAQIAQPSLPIVMQPVQEIGNVSAKIMEKRLKGEKESFPEMVTLPTKIHFT